MIPATELERLCKQHAADYWQEPGNEAMSELLESFGIEPTEMVQFAAAAATGPVSPHTKLGQTAIFMQGLLLGLDIARQLETASLRVEADHFRDAAVQYGRLLQAVVGREGGELILDQDELLNDTAIVVPCSEGDKIVVRLESFDAA